MKFEITLKGGARRFSTNVLLYVSILHCFRGGTLYVAAYELEKSCFNETCSCSGRLDSKSYVLCGLSNGTPITLSDIGHFCCLKCFQLPYLMKYSMYYIWWRRLANVNRMQRHMHCYIGDCKTKFCIGSEIGFLQCFKNADGMTIPVAII